MKTFLGIELSTVKQTKKLNLSNLFDLEKAISIIRLSILQKHIDNGVIFRNIDNIYIYDSVIIGEGTTIYDDQHIRGNTIIGKNCILDTGNVIEDSIIGDNITIIKSVIKNSTIGSKTTIGPFAHVHTNSKIDKSCRIGNFVEIKNSTTGIETKMAHLAYIGDVDIGNLCNIGCGSIFVNYDGKNKHRSLIGDSVFVGSNSNIVAPVTIEDNAYIAAGTTVTVDLPKNCMCIGRNRETIKENRSKYKKNVFVKQYFGTDGIRGIYGEEITDEIAYMTGNFLGYSANGGVIVVGRDTRLSGDNLSIALIKGITDAGSTAVDLEITSTPCVAFVTTHINANYGVVLSASHNPWQYNGIKIFNNYGRKLTSIEEVEIETHIKSNQPIIESNPGIKKDGRKYKSIYLDDLCKLTGSLKGLKVVIDCSNGAVFKSAPLVFEKLGATVYAYNTSSNGGIINKDCGAVHPEFCAEKVVYHKADIGFSYDGDADRIIAVDKNGKIVDGDSIIYLIAVYLKNKNCLSANTVVGTSMSNMGVELSLKKEGISLIRTDVGDHHVMEALVRNNLLVGGEQSGHIILREFSDAGDGLLASLYLCKLLKDTNKTIDQLDTSIHFPQVMINLVTKAKKEIMTSPLLAEFKEKIEQELNGKGRILFRASGTEPKIRIMVECEDGELAKKYANSLKEFVEANFKL